MRVVNRQSKAENTRFLLVRSAAELFDRNGFSGTTVTEVSTFAGVTKGAFYFHFTSKDQLGAAVQEEACALLRAAVVRAAASRLPALQLVVDLTHEVAEWLTDEPLVRASFRIARQCGHQSELFLNFYAEWRMAVETLLARAGRQGELAVNVSVEHAVTLVLAVTGGLEMMWWAGIRDGSMIDSLSELWSMVLPGIVTAGLGRRLRAAGSHSVLVPLNQRG